MTDMNQPAPVQGTAPLSTSIDQGGAPLGSGGGVPNLAEPKAPEAPKVDKPESAGDTLKGELARIRDEEAKEGKGDDAAKEAKAKADDAAKAADKQKPVADAAKTDPKEPAVEAEKSDAEKLAAGQEGEDKPRPSEGSKRHEPPARFLPEARAKWANVPNEVKTEVHRVSQEYEGEIERARQTAEAYEPIRQFDDMARASGKKLPDVIGAYVGMENMLRTDPVRGMAEILRNIGLTPEQYANHVLENADVHRQALVRQQPQPQQQRQPDPEVQELRAELQSMKVEQTVLPVVHQFRTSHPDFEALSPKITSIIRSGVIEQVYGNGLSLEQKLSEAYRMAGGNPPSRSDALDAGSAHSAAASARPVNPDDGTKSIRGAPNGGTDPDDDDADANDIRKLLRREMRKAS